MGCQGVWCVRFLVWTIVILSCQLGAAMNPPCDPKECDCACVDVVCNPSDFPGQHNLRAICLGKCHEDCKSKPGHSNSPPAHVVADHFSKPQGVYGGGKGGCDCHCRCVEETCNGKKFEAFRASKRAYEMQTECRINCHDDCKKEKDHDNTAPGHAVLDQDEEEHTKRKRSGAVDHDINSLNSTHYID